MNPKMSFLVTLLLPFLIHTKDLPDAPANAVNVSFIRECGFLITGGGKKVMAEGLFSGTDAMLRERMTQNAAPFDNVDLIVISDPHGQHYKNDYMAQLMESCPNLECIAPPGAYADIQSQSTQWEQIQNRMHTWQLDMLASIDTVIQDIPVRITGMAHDVNMPDVGVFGFTFEINGMRIFHTSHGGDYDGELAVAGAGFDAVDLAFLNIFYYQFNEMSFTRTKEELDPRHLVITHFNASSYDQTVVDEIIEKATTEFGGASYFSTPMEVVQFRRQDDQTVCDTLNQAPFCSVDKLPEIRVEAGTEIEVPLDPGLFTDPDEGDILDYWLITTANKPVPDWLQFDETKLILHGVPPEKERFTVRIMATDSYYSTASCYMKVRIDAASTSVTAEPKPQVFQLMPNHPNPFNAQTMIDYRLSSGSHVTVKVYDIHGREITVLVNEVQQAGSHSVRFDGVNVASGMYLIELQAGNLIQRQKMLLVK